MKNKTKSVNQIKYLKCEASNGIKRILDICEAEIFNILYVPKKRFIK